MEQEVEGAVLAVKVSSPVVGEEPTSIVVDNTQGTTVGSWPTSTSVSGFFGTNYQVHAAGAGSETFTWTPTIPATGTYNVYARWTAHPNRSTHALYTVNHAGGSTAVTRGFPGARSR